MLLLAFHALRLLHCPETQDTERVERFVAKGDRSSFLIGPLEHDSTRHPLQAVAIFPK